MSARTTDLSGWIGPAAVLAVSAAAFLLRDPRPAEDDLVLIPFGVDAARVARVTEAQLLVADPSGGQGPVRVEALRLIADGLVLLELPQQATLVGDPEYGAVQALIERLPESVTERHRPRAFAAPDAPEFAEGEVGARWAEAAERLEALRARWRAGAPLPFVQLDFPLPLDQVFAGDEAPGTTVAFTVEVDWRPAGGERRPLRTARATHAVRWLAPLPGLPPTLAGAGSDALQLVSGDLHVHSCHGEAVGACAPSSDCAAESLQTSGSFSYAQLKTQYQALGVAWFTATDHSYCITSANEYTAIANECAALTDASFVALPDIELSNEEQGPQTGGDLGNVLCLFGQKQNHMGAHGITSRKPGGTNGFLGFCDNLLKTADNIAAVRAEGGMGIAHHPAASSFAWNSFAITTGLEAAGLHGVEIWNGATQVGQGDDVASWVDWLLAGRVLYAYSGSDTHDAAFSFGVNRVCLDGPLSEAALRDGLAAGRVFVSDGHSLVLEVDRGGRTLPMGWLEAVPVTAPASAALVRAHYDFGADTATITLFAGKAGDPSETVLGASPPLTGSGVFELNATVPAAAFSWFRAYSEGQATAYTNPVFFLPGLGDVATYCTAKQNSQGCLPAIESHGAPSASLPAPFTVEASNVLNNKSGILFFGTTPASAPFQGGTLCVAPPIQRTPAVQSGGNPPPNDCSGRLVLDVNALIQGGTKPALVAGATIHAQFYHRDPQASFGVGLTDGIRFTIRP